MTDQPYRSVAARSGPAPTFRPRSIRDHLRRFWRRHLVAMHRRCVPYRAVWRCASCANYVAVRSVVCPGRIDGFLSYIPCLCGDVRVLVGDFR